jgi:hypothetical protein
MGDEARYKDQIKGPKRAFQSPFCPGIPAERRPAPTSEGDVCLCAADQPGLKMVVSSDDQG